MGGRHEPARGLLWFVAGGFIMKYGIAWLVGIPPVLIAIWFLANHC